MCVQTANKSWERGATVEDAKILEKFFNGVDLVGFLKVMQTDGGVPLVTDLALIGGVLTIKKNKFGVPYLPFTALEKVSKSCIKIPEMENIVDWMENTALGSHMWSFANKFAEENYGRKFTFSMNCGCTAATLKQFADGTVANWNKYLNGYAKDMYGKTNVVYSDNISGTNMGDVERNMWKKIREAVSALPYVEANFTNYILLNQKNEESILR